VQPICDNPRGQDWAPRRLPFMLGTRRQSHSGVVRESRKNESLVLNPDDLLRAPPTLLLGARRRESAVQVRLVGGYILKATPGSRWMQNVPSKWLIERLSIKLPFAECYGAGSACPPPARPPLSSSNKESSSSMSLLSKYQ
jgi:hypothetical protein